MEFCGSVGNVDRGYVIVKGKLRKLLQEKHSPSL